MPNLLEIVDRTADGRIEVALRSENERDLHAMIEDPYAHIMAIALLMGYTLTIQDTSTNVPGEQPLRDANVRRALEKQQAAEITETGDE